MPTSRPPPRSHFFSSLVSCVSNLLVGHRGAVVRIGAHLGFFNTNDPLRGALTRVLNRTEAGSGRAPMVLLVEPQPRVFAQLSKLLQQHSYGAHVAAEQAAVCATDGNVTLYSIADADPLTGAISPGHSLPVGATQLASMSREHILRHQKYVHNGERLANYIRELVVQCYSVPTLLARHAIAPHYLKVLTVDAEGFDLSILEPIDFHATTPDLIVWEQTHINKQQSDGKNRTRTFIARLEEQHEYLCNDKSDFENVFCLKRRAARSGAPECAAAFDPGDGRLTRGGRRVAEMAGTLGRPQTSC